MTPRIRVFTTSIGTKLLIALTGLLLFIYLVLHLAGNLLVFLGPEVFNEYSHRLVSNPLVVPAEIALLAVFLIHVYKAIRMWRANRQARPVGYARKSWAGSPSRKSLASTTMILSGILLLLFVVIHVRTFKYGAYYEIAGSGVRDLYRLEQENFASPLTVGFYIVCMVLVGFHLWHGFASAFQSLGLDHPHYTPTIRTAGKILAVVIAGGFLLIPVIMFLQRGVS